MSTLAIILACIAAALFQAQKHYVKIKASGRAFGWRRYIRSNAVKAALGVMGSWLSVRLTPYFVEHPVTDEVAFQVLAGLFGYFGFRELIDSIEANIPAFRKVIVDKIMRWMGVVVLIAAAGCVSQKADQQRLARIRERNPQLFDTATVRKTDTVPGQDQTVTVPVHDTVFRQRHDTVRRVDTLVKERGIIAYRTDTSFTVECPPCDTVVRTNTRVETRTVQKGTPDAWWEPWGYLVLIGLLALIALAGVLR